MKTFTSASKKLTLIVTISGIVFGSCKKKETDWVEETPTQPASAAITTFKTVPAPVTTGTYTPSTWVFDKLTNQYQAYIINPDITEEVLRNGMVQVFLQTTENRYLPLPITSYEKKYTMTYSMELSLIKIEMQYEDLGQGPMPGDLTFRIATISGQFIKEHPGLDMRDYSKLTHTAEQQ